MKASWATAVFVCVSYNRRLLFFLIFIFLVLLFATEIISSSTLPEPTKREESVAWYPWTINNKYYTADVRLCVVPSTFQMSSEIAQSMQAFIAYFDSTVVRDLTESENLKSLPCHACVTLIVCACCLQKDGLEKLHPWISVVEDLAPEVLILVCDRVCENG